MERQESRHQELVLTPLPWTVVYTVRDYRVFIVCILHGAQRWCLVRRVVARPRKGTINGQWRAMPDGNDGITGVPGNVVSVSCRI